MTCKQLYRQLKACYFNAYAKGVSRNGRYMSYTERNDWLDWLEYELTKCRINTEQANILIQFVCRNARTHSDELSLLWHTGK